MSDHQQECEKNELILRQRQHIERLFYELSTANDKIAELSGKKAKSSTKKVRKDHGVKEGQT